MCRLHRVVLCALALKASLAARVQTLNGLQNGESEPPRTWAQIATPAQGKGTNSDTPALNGSSKRLQDQRQPASRPRPQPRPSVSRPAIRKVIDSFRASGSCSLPAYYKGVDLRSPQALHIRLRKGSRKVSYKKVWKHYEFLDRDDIENNKLNMIYSSSPRANNHQAAKWNREHVWPKSYGVSCKNGGGYKENNGPFTDLHHLYPADIKINAKRSSRYFDTCKRIAGPDLKGRLKPDCREVQNDGFAFPDTGYSIDGSFWMPPPKSRGIIARALFFMALRYDGEEPLTRDLKLANCPKYCRFQLGKLDALLDWHHQYPPTDEEKLRNAKVCTVQGNRNPFVDHPDLVQEFFNSSSSYPHLISTDCRPCPARDSAPESAKCSEWRN